MLGSNFVKFLMSILKWQLDSSPTFVSLFSFMRDYCSVLSSAWVKFCQIPYANFETMSLLLSKFCIPLHFHERLLLYTFLAGTIYTFLIRSPLKWKSLWFLSTQVKICQIPYANFKTSWFHSKFCIPHQFHER